MANHRNANPIEVVEMMPGPIAVVEGAAEEESGVEENGSDQGRTDTDPPAFDIPYNEYWSTALGMPSLGTSGNPGQLLDVIPDANCGNTNELINPIDGTTCIDKDLLGSDRWDTSNNKRNIGASNWRRRPYCRSSVWVMGR